VEQRGNVVDPPHSRASVVQFDVRGEVEQLRFGRENAHAARAQRYLHRVIPKPHDRHPLHVIARINQMPVQFNSETRWRFPHPGNLGPNRPHLVPYMLSASALFTA